MDLPSDGKEAAVISSETGSYQLFSISTETTETTQLSTGEDRVVYAAFSPDSQRVALSLGNLPAGRNTLLGKVLDLVAP